MTPGDSTRHARNMKAVKIAIEDHVIEAIVDELKRGDGLNDPRPLAGRPSSLDKYVRGEAPRSVDHIRIRRAHPNPDVTDIRKAEKAMRNVRFNFKPPLPPHLFDQAHDLLVKLSSSPLYRAPSKKSDRLKLYCADEAFDLMFRFSKTEPTGTGRSDKAPGPFQTIAALLYGAIAGPRHDGEPHSMQRACTAVLEHREKFSVPWRKVEAGHG